MIEKGLELKQKEYDTKSAGRVDLLCIDRNRDFVVIETKKGNETVADGGKILKDLKELPFRMRWK
jgi:RecB family endonuclease NucS